MLEAILAALVAIATRGECYEADRYPTDTSDITGYVVVERCTIPTTPELPAKTLCSMAQQISDPTGQGRTIDCQ